MEFVDQLHRTLSISEIPSRIISLVPSQTELLVDLGLRDNIVGVTKFCVHPKDLRKQKTIVGGTKKVDFEKIESLRPEIIICNKEENTKEMVIKLDKIAPVWVSDIATIEDNNEMILKLGDLLGASERATEIVEKIKEGLANLKDFVKSFPTRKVLYLIWKNPYMAAGNNTFINELLRLNRIENIISDENSRYPEIDIYNMKSAEIVFLSTEPFPFKEEDAVELSNNIKTKVKLVDGEYFSWYGTRLIVAFEYFKKLHQKL